jgi:hypothetical protein
MREQVERLQTQVRESLQVQCQEQLDLYSEQTHMYRKHLEKDLRNSLIVVRDAASQSVADELAKAAAEWQQAIKKMLDELQVTNSRQGVARDLRAHLRMHALATGNMTYAYTHTHTHARTHTHTHSI